ncbi:hypothetical protein QYF61_009219 [Mycteria americana]|uniref:Uncharacterized protein n=1 Tax=Mycteria americana TaxID=33587 RepID=A0AAN7NYG2_MYCAM|nr:hypothetical protein QYF61_009219 [Mycteria americana]
MLTGPDHLVVLYMPCDGTQDDLLHNLPQHRGEVFHPSDHFCGPPLDPLQQVHVFPVLRSPELDAVLQVGSHQSRVEGQNPLPQPAGHAAFDAAQDTVGLVGCERTLLAHVQLFIHQYPQVLLHRAALNPFIPQPVWIPGAALTQVHLAFLKLMRFTQAHFSSLSRSLWMASHPSGVSNAPLKKHYYLHVSTFPLTGLPIMEEYSAAQLRMWFTSGYRA